MTPPAGHAPGKFLPLPSVVRSLALALSIEGEKGALVSVPHSSWEWLLSDIGLVTVLPQVGRAQGKRLYLQSSQGVITLGYDYRE